MLKFTAMQLVDDKDVKCMIFIVCQHAILSSIELYENIHLYRLPTPNPQPQYYPQSRYSHIFDATQDIFALTQPHKNLFEPNTFSFTQFLSAPFSINLLDSQTFDAIDDSPRSYLSTSAVESTSLTQPNEPKCTTKPGLPNKELGAFSED